jgi:acylphosphatase
MTHRVAGRFEVTGYVQNLPDGRVKVVAEGSKNVLQVFLEAIQETMSGYIKETQIDESSPTGEFHRFDIRF